MLTHLLFWGSWTCWGKCSFWCKVDQQILIADWSSSYHHDSIVKGFCHINVSGTGMSDLGELTIMPATGELKTGAGTQDNHMAGCSSLYRKKKEFASVGYYKVHLERYDIDVELTATEK